MCDCVSRWFAYSSARRVLERALQTPVACDEQLLAYKTTWARYDQARAQCTNPGKHPHRCE